MADREQRAAERRGDPSAERDGRHRLQHYVGTELHGRGQANVFSLHRQLERVHTNVGDDIQQIRGRDRHRYFDAGTGTGGPGRHASGVAVEFRPVAVVDRRARETERRARRTRAAQNVHERHGR